MKTRWMKSVIETSRQPLPALPFQRRTRRHRAALSAGTTHGMSRSANRGLKIA